MTMQPCDELEYPPSSTSKVLRERIAEKIEAKITYYSAKITSEPNADMRVRYTATLLGLLLAKEIVSEEKE